MTVFRYSNPSGGGETDDQIKKRQEHEARFNPNSRWYWIRKDRQHRKCKKRKAQ